MTGASALPQREPRDVWAIRQAVQRWPLPRGRGVLLRLAHRRLARRDFPVVVGPGALIEPQFEDWIVRYAFEGRHRRDPAFRFAFSLLRPGDAAFDVGANVGLWSLLAAQRVGAAGRIWAFEAIPSTACRLERNRSLSGSPRQLIVENLAASDSTGTITINETGPGNSAVATLRPIQGGHPQTVRSTSLDTYWRELGEPSLRLLKVDTEGAEYKVLSGAVELLCGPPIRSWSSSATSNSFPRRVPAQQTCFSCSPSAGTASTSCVEVGWRRPLRPVSIGISWRSRARLDRVRGVAVRRITPYTAPVSQ